MKKPSGEYVFLSIVYTGVSVWCNREQLSFAAQNGLWWFFGLYGTAYLVSLGIIGLLTYSFRATARSSGKEL